VVGTVSMDSFAVELPEELPRGTAVTLIGDGLLVESHAARAGTINYEITTGIRLPPERARRLFIDG
jgi:alanine racemase